MNGAMISNKQNSSLIAASYKPMPSFESLIGTHIRSDNFKIKGPSTSAHFKKGSTILFEWETEITHPLSLEVIDNHGKIVFDSQPVYDKFLKLSSGDLNEGLFYFKILKDDEIVFFGKFFIDKK
jgi:hypothetical protein